MRYGTVLMAALACVLSASLAFAGPRGWGQDMGPGYGGSAYAGSLTPEQSQKLQSLREAHTKEITPLQIQLFSKKSELRLL